MKQRRLHSHGFTLVEVMASTAITGILIVVIMGFITNSLVSTTIDSTRGDMLREAEEAMDVITRDIRLSASAEDNNRWQDTYAPNAPTDLYSWQSDADTLILATAALDTNRNVLFEDALHYITYKNNNIYFVSGGKLYKRTLAATIASNAAKTSCPAAHATSTCPADSVLATNIASFQVHYISGDGAEVDPTDARSIELDINLQATKYNKSISASYKTRTVFRND